MISLSCLIEKRYRCMKMRGAKDRPPMRVKFRGKIGEAVLDNRTIVLKDKDGYYR